MSLDALKKEYKAGKLSKPDFIDAAYAQHQALYGYAEAMRQSDIASITLGPDGIVFETKDGIHFISDTPDKRIAPIEIMNFDRYEPELVRAMRVLIQPNMCVFDVGANIGWFSLFANILCDDLTLHAFEPVSPVYDKLQRNLTLNDAANIAAHPFGLSDKSGSLELHYNEAYSSQSSLADLGNIETNKVICEFQTMDAFADANALSPDLIKCDVEGAELLTLKGGLGTIERAQPIILCEMLRKWAQKFEYHPNDIIALLKPLGYGCFALSANGAHALKNVTDKTEETNFVFLNETKHAAFLGPLT